MHGNSPPARFISDTRKGPVASSAAGPLFLPVGPEAVR